MIGSRFDHTARTLFAHTVVVTGQPGNLSLECGHCMHTLNWREHPSSCPNCGTKLFFAAADCSLRPTRPRGMPLGSRRLFGTEKPIFIGFYHATIGGFVLEEDYTRHLPAVPSGT